MKEVISENEHLHEAQKNKLITKMFHSYNGSETDDLDDIGDSTGLDSDHRVSFFFNIKFLKKKGTCHGTPVNIENTEKQRSI